MIETPFWGDQARRIAPVIGVVACEDEHPEIREFFELFKTPWEFFRPDGEYEVVLCSGTPWRQVSAKLVLVYEAQQESEIESRTRHSCVVVSYKGDRIPIYGGVTAIEDSGDAILRLEGTGESAGSSTIANGQGLIRIGYDLFCEIRHLLTKGQPASEARIPTLELHIALLRDMVVRFGIPLVEIPPVPAGYRFIACLTHDVDHPAIRNHVFDHTMFGFLYRATVGSVIDLFRGRKTLRQLIRNGIAALSLPLVYAGRIKDPWDQFDRYLEIEKGAASTFFVIPKKGDPGAAFAEGPAEKRAAKYEAREIAGELRKLEEAGGEIAVHGIDAWNNAEAGRSELETVKALTRRRELGVRMHWLYSDERSAMALENAGFSYDSTCGYNETVGYRAGTLQAFRPLSAKRLMELPMHVMDTALFFGGHSDYSAKRAESVIQETVEHAVRFGGALTFNWHDRSIAPERLWDKSYVRLLNELRSRGAWITSAGQAVAWFRRRRDARVVDGRVAEQADVQSEVKVPGLRLYVHQNQTRPSTILGRKIENEILTV